MQLMIEVERRRVTTPALPFAEEHRLSPQFGFAGPRRIEPSSRCIQFGGGRKIQHVLHLRHVTYLDAVQYVHTLLAGMNFIAIEICGSLFEFGEVFHRPQASLRPMDLLVEYAAQAGSI